MTGDDVSAGDHPEAKPIYDVDSVQLLRIARIMRDDGVYLSGRKLESPPSFLIGAVENPFAPPLDFRPMRLGKKVQAGAEFIQTQICFNLERMRLFLARAGDLGNLTVPILAGVFLLAFLGVGGENTDVLAHLTGFGMGTLAGIAHAVWRVPRGRAAQLVAGCAAVATLIVAWALALSRA